MVEEERLKLRDYIWVVNRRKWIIVAATLTTIAVAAIASLLIPPSYTSRVTLRLAVAATGNVDYAEVSHLTVLMNTYAKLVVSDPFKQELIQQLELNKLPKITAEAVPGTELLEITVKAPSSTLAAETAQALADLLILQSGELYAGTNKLGAQTLQQEIDRVEKELRETREEYINATEAQELLSLEQSIARKEATHEMLLEQYEQVRTRELMLSNTLSIVDPPDIPEAPSSPRKGRDLALATVIGLVGGFGLAFVFENLDTTLRTAQQIEQVSHLPVLGQIRYFGKGRGQRLFDSDSSPGRVFAWLGASLLKITRDTPPHTILVTSEGPKEGKSTVVVNMACALGRLGQKVIVVDCNFRQPVLHERFAVPNKTGLTSVLKGETELDKAICSGNVPGVSVLPSGPKPQDPVSWLGHQHISGIVERLSTHFDYVLLDSSSLSAGSEIVALASVTDGVLLVIESGKAREKDILTTLRQLDSIGARPIGIIVNRAEADGP